MKLENAKGTRDFMPEDQILIEEILDKIKEIFKIYGYQPLQTPALERLDVLTAKYAGGSELLKETFTLEDQGKRKLALRNEFTVPLARIMASRRDIKFPFKRYQIGSIWRDGPVEKNRYREFLQCDVDIIGCKEMTAEAELMLMTGQIFDLLGLKYEILINNRKILNELMKYFKISDLNQTLISLDKLDKIGKNGVKEELKEVKNAEKLLEFIDKINNKKNEDILKEIEKISKQGVEELKEILKLTGKTNIKIAPYLVRGLGYYTGPIFEVILINSEIKVSVAGGGRWDDMIKEYANETKEFPAVGISFGVSRIFDELKKTQIKKTTTEVFVIPINTFKQSLEITQKLRKQGINTDIDLVGKGLSKNLNFVNSLGIPYVLFIGDEELKTDKLKLKNMETGLEESITLDKLIKKLEDNK
ncbi:histidine--tRNA ligase [Candidatus Micrarchaeota archaeon]|jgi:histidyl-tRNA synthetase|nr:histidine--tRNA ligase [Candidatus Micrarchaeota archaeon]